MTMMMAMLTVTQRMVTEAVALLIMMMMMSMFSLVRLVMTDTHTMVSIYSSCTCGTVKLSLFAVQSIELFWRF